MKEITQEITDLPVGVQLAYTRWKKQLSMLIQEKFAIDLNWSFILDLYCTPVEFYTALLENKGKFKKLEKKRVCEITPDLKYEYEMVSHEFVAPADELPKLLDNDNAWRKAYSILEMSYIFVAKRVVFTYTEALGNLKLECQCSVFQKGLTDTYFSRLTRE
jgi:hypothetical protein